MTARRAAPAVAFAVAVAVSGCSQIDALAPVGGNAQAEVRFAAIDVLVGAGVEILVAPVCVGASGGDLTCTGETVSGEVISVHSPADSDDMLTVTVGSDVLYSGSVTAVLDAAARETE
ncbi:hypothetical protein [Rhodococcus gannanensis]|uniref:DUF4333 domain-containing protein n=1 Tax=Rhodococcus gannanensis TaxID=1960308 RepID=A0ABW4P8G6_9NOCA